MLERLAGRAGAPLQQGEASVRGERPWLARALLPGRWHTVGAQEAPRGECALRPTVGHEGAETRGGGPEVWPAPHVSLCRASVGLGPLTPSARPHQPCRPTTPNGCVSGL